MKLHLLLTFLFGLFATAGAGATEIDSAARPQRPSNTAAGNSSAPVFSGDGRFVAFLSHARNLATNGSVGPALNLYLRHRETRQTTLVSLDAAGQHGAADDVGQFSVSLDAARIAFETAANNLVAGDTNRVTDIFLHDRITGTTTLITRDATGTGGANGPSWNPLLSEDGRFVAFESLASNLVTNDFNGTNDVFVHDLATGQTELVSLDTSGLRSPDGPSQSPSISADGQAVAFLSFATNLVDGVTNRLGEVYVRDVARKSTRWAEASHLLATWQRIPAGGRPSSYAASEPELSASGRYVTFKTPSATVRLDLSRPARGISELFTNAAINELNRLTFVDNPRLAGPPSPAPLGVHRDGSHLVYELSSTNTFLQDRGLWWVDWDDLQTNVFFDPCVGCGEGGHSDWSGYVTNVTPRIERVVTNQTIISAGLTWTRIDWLGCAAATRRVAFLADAFDTSTSQQSGPRQLYAVNLDDREVRLISTNLPGQASAELSPIVPALSADGQSLAWESRDANLIENDGNDAYDVFVDATAGGSRTLISEAHPDRVAATGTGQLLRDRPSLSADGRYVALVSLDSTLTPSDTNRWEDVFVRDLWLGTNYAISARSSSNVFGTRWAGTNAAVAPVLSADGQQVAFARDVRSIERTNRTIELAGLTSPEIRSIASSVNFGATLSAPVISPSGRLIAYSSPNGAAQRDVYLYARGRPPGLIPSGNFGTNPALVSSTPNGRAPGNQPSSDPVFSPDGTWLVFRSLATNLIAGAAASTTDYQLYARQVDCNDAICVTNIAYNPDMYLGPTRLISSEPVAEVPGLTPLPGGGSEPAFSANSRYVAYSSDADRIYRHDLQAPLGSASQLICTNCAAPALNGDGTLIAFEQRNPTGTNIVLRNLTTGADELISARPEVALPTGGNGPSVQPILSADGRFVVFVSRATDLAPGDHNGAPDVFLRDRWNGVTLCLSRSASDNGTGHGASFNPVLSANARTLAFLSWADDLTGGDYNDRRDLFVVTLAGSDRDGDGMDDEMELAYFNTLERDGHGDFDGDGVSDAAELQAGTNPADGASVFGALAITTSRMGPSSFGIRTTAVTWRSTPGQRYQLQHRPSLEDSSWSDVGAPLTASGNTLSQFHQVQETGSAGGRTGFYRVRRAD